MAHSLARRIERCCCSCISCVPLVFVYGLTGWAAWVQAHIGLLGVEGVWTGKLTALIGLSLFGLLNWSYTTAVFTDPGSPMNRADTYNLEGAHLPQTHNSLMVKSTGEGRFCKKCHTEKPDRAHHCSSCRRCVLKMDHHCPWLATCVGLRNYKAFLLFLIYTCLFCWFCFAVSISWVWGELSERMNLSDRLMPVNYILLATLSGIIGLVLSGFTSWHIYLTVKGQTTIESLESTRYLSPLREAVQRQNAVANEPGHVQGIAEQLQEIHANAIPGATRIEEGQENGPRSRTPQHRSRWELDDQRERERYEQYLDERDSEKLPNAFDLGWRRNMRQVFGPKPSLWFLPICNSIGDGWSWEVSEKWTRERDIISEARAAQTHENVDSGYRPSEWRAPLYHDFDARRTASAQASHGPPPRSRPPSSADGHGTGDGSDDEDDERLSRRPLMSGNQHDAPTASWNDVPENFFDGMKDRSGARTPNSSNRHR